MKNNKFNFEKGDVIEFCDELYYVIDNRGSSGTVSPFGETFYLRNFVWAYGDDICKFVRKPTLGELEKLGLVDIKKTYNIAIGLNAGIDLTTETNVVIIGDNVRSLDRSQKNVLFVGDNMAIGDTIMGEPFNLKEVLIKNFKKQQDGK